MASLGNTIINGILRINGKLIVGESITAPSFIGKLTGNADTATSAATLTTARTINGTSFNGSANITTANWGTARNIGIVNSDGTGTAVTVSVNGSANTNLKLPATIKASLTGNASTASSAAKLTTARTINGTSFDGSGNITTANWGTARNVGIVNSDGTGTAVTVSVNGSGNVNLKLPAAITASLTGNASTATKLQTARTINGTSFDGSANITTANWGTARNITIQDSTAAHSGTAVSVNGSGNVNLKLPATITASLVGNADTATKLKTARTITNSGELTGSFSFDGSGNVTNTAYIRYAKATKGNTSTYPFCRIATSGVMTGQYQDKVSLIYITQDYIGGSFGLIRVTVRTNGSTQTATAEAKWLIRSGFAADNVQIGLYNVYGKTYLDVFCKINGGYGSITARFLDGTRGNVGQQWTLISSYETDNGATHSECYKTIQGTTAGAAAQDLHSGTQYTNVISGTDAGIVSVSNSTSGNAASATKLQTARTIGVSGVTGTAQSFNGTANIVIPITAVPASLLTGKSAIKGSEITNDKHWVESSDSSVTNIRQGNYSSINMTGLSDTEVVVVSGVGYVTTQETSLTCDLPLDL